VCGEAIMRVCDDLAGHRRSAPRSSSVRNLAGDVSIPGDTLQRILDGATAGLAASFPCADTVLSHAVPTTPGKIDSRRNDTPFSENHGILRFLSDNTNRFRLCKGWGRVFRGASRLRRTMCSA
jgi:hypothetical protein